MALSLVASRTVLSISCTSATYGIGEKRCNRSCRFAMLWPLPRRAVESHRAGASAISSAIVLKLLRTLVIGSCQRMRQQVAQQPLAVFLRTEALHWVRKATVRRSPLARGEPQRILGAGPARCENGLDCLS